jgi:hypothetical protein
MFVLRMLTYLWALPTTMFGLLFVPLAIFSRGGVRFVSGVIEVHGGIVDFFLRRCTLLPNGASAMTLGHVVLGRDQFLLDATRDHERVHVKQAERWGPLFIPAYLTTSIVQWARGKRAYDDNPFEREAFEHS